jgi:hypothetical protein
VETLVKLAPELAAETNGAGVSALYLAVMSRSVDSVRAIVDVSHGDASAAGPDSQNALHAAVLQSSGLFISKKSLSFYISKKYVVKKL